VTAGGVRWIVLPERGPASPLAAATVLDRAGNVLAVVAEPAQPPEVAALRDEVIARVLDEDFGETILAGVAFAPRWGGDAVGFT
jgi:hypothetical protein